MTRIHKGDFPKGHVPVNKTHGESAYHDRAPSKEYRAWLKMKERCFDTKNKRYHRYGGRGITVCDEWKTSYDLFLRDMGRAPSKDHSLERIDVNGDYEPGNCKWATKLEQANNTSTNRVFYYQGKSLTVAQWARHLGIKYSVLNKRLFRGWSFERAVTTKKRSWPLSKQEAAAIGILTISQ